MTKKSLLILLFCIIQIMVYGQSPEQNHEKYWYYRYRFTINRLTVWRLAKVAIFTTNVDAENQCLFNHKTVIRSTEPPIFFRYC